MTVAYADATIEAAARGAIAMVRAQKQARSRPPKFAKYEAAPVEFVDEVLHEETWSGQRTILESIRDSRHTAVKACHGPGKSFIAARAAAWWLSAHKPGEAFVVTSAPTAPQVRAILWREIGRAHAHGHLPGRVNQTEWWMGPGAEHYAQARTGDEELVAFGRKPANPAGGAEGDGLTVTAFQGIHAKYVLVILDEADGIPESLFNAAESLATNEGCRVLAIGNPDHASSAFAGKCKPGTGWNVITISAFDTPNFTGEAVSPALSSVLVSKLWVAEAEQRWGVTSPLYASKVLGEFPVDDTDGLIPWSWVERCQVDREFAPDDLLPVELGVDIGAGGDLTVVRERRGMRIGRQWTARTPESTQAVGLVRQAIAETGAKRAKIDTIGVGWGVVGLLTDQGRNGEHQCEIIGVNVAASPGGLTQTKRPDAPPHQFAKVRDEVGWNMRVLVQDGAIDLRGLDDDTLTQMIAPRYGLDSSGRIKVEAKEDTSKRVGHSPDKWDALALAFYEPRTSGWADYAADENARTERERATELAAIEATRGR